MNTTSNIVLALVAMQLSSQLFLDQVQATSPNIIYVIIDDAGLGDFTSFTPTSPVSTPNLDALAAQGMRFTNAYSSAPVCAPARSSLMTGKHMGHASVRSNSGGTNLLRSDYTVAELMKDAGYETAGFGKWGLGNTGTTGAPELQGWDRFFGYNHQVHAHNHYTNNLRENGRVVSLPENNGAPNGGLVEPSRTHTFNLYTQQMQDYVQEKALANSSFFAYGAWTPPHLDNELPADEPLYQQYANVPGWDQGTKIQATFISMIDREVGRLMDIVNDPNGDGNNSDSIADNTLLMFVSDNGGSLGGIDYDRNPGLRGQKGTLYEGGLKIPMIASWQGKIPAGSSSNLPTYFADIMPTFGDLAGVSNLIPSDTDGISLAPTITAEGIQQQHQYLYFEDEPYNFGNGTLSGNLRQAVKMGDWKAVKNGTNNNIELYDLATDPDESSNVAAANPTIVAQMASIMDAEHEDARIQLDTNFGSNGSATVRGIRHHIRTIAPLQNSSFESPQLTSNFLNGGSDGWDGGFIQNVPITEVNNGTAMFMDPTPDGVQVGGLNNNSSISQALFDGNGETWELFLDDLEQEWVVDLHIGKRVDGSNGNTQLLVELVGDSGATYLEAIYDTALLNPGEWSIESLVLLPAKSTPARSLMNADLGKGLSLVFSNIGGSGQVLFDSVSVTVMSDWIPGDFTSDGQITLADWITLQSNLLTDTSSLNFEQAYALGDINYSGRVGPEDFSEFKKSWELLYGTAALAQLTAVPEPSTGMILVLFVTLLSTQSSRLGILQSQFR